MTDIGKRSRKEMLIKRMKDEERNKARIWAKMPTNSWQKGKVQRIKMEGANRVILFTLYEYHCKGANSLIYYTAFIIVAIDSYTKPFSALIFSSEAASCSKDMDVKRVVLHMYQSYA
jgi:hypothetical protein